MSLKIHSSAFQNILQKYEMEELKVLELFSGVGGYHSALQIIEGKLRRHKLRVIGAVDINTVSNEV